MIPNNTLPPSSAKSVHPYGSVNVERERNLFNQSINHIRSALEHYKALTYSQEKLLPRYLNLLKVIPLHCFIYIKIKQCCWLFLEDVQCGESREQRAESREQRAESREQRAESREQRTIESPTLCL